MTNELRNVPDLRFPGFEGEWEESNIDNEFDFFNNKRKPIKENLRNKGEYPYYGATGIIDYVDDFIFDGNFILIGEDGANIVSRSAPLVYFATGKFWVNNHAHILYPKFGDIYFNYLLLENIDYEKYNTGTAQPKLNVQNLKKIKIKSPRDNSEQQKIGKFFSKLDRQIELEEQKLAKLEEQKKGYMQKIFSQELRFKDENGNDYPEWEEINLGSLYKTGKAGGTPKSTESKYYNGKVPFLSISDITKQGKFLNTTEKKITQEGLDNSTAWLVPVNSINYAMYASVGYLSINKIEVATSQAIFNMVFEDYNLVEYLYYYLNYIRDKGVLEKLMGTGTQSNLSASIMKNITVKLPSKNEIIKTSKFLGNVDELIETQSSKVELLKERKKGFLQKMFV